MRFALTIGFSIALLCTPHPGDTAQGSVPACPARFSTLLADSIFRGYAVRATTRVPRLVEPNVRSGRARLYRTRIREGAAQGPNFAGHYTIIPIGCGAATVCVAIVDATTGHVYFPPGLSSAEALIVDTAGLNLETLNFRRGSSLLIVVGSPNEQRRRAGISYYTWRSDRLDLIRFIPVAQLCGLSASTRF